MIRNAADLEELIQNSLDDIDSASDETILPQVRQYFEKGGSTSDLIEVLKSKMTCAVCLEIPVEGCQLTECKHVFCKYCLKLWFLNIVSCPLCRNEMIDEPRHLTAIDHVVEKIIRTHDANYWKMRVEEDKAIMHRFVIKFCTEKMPSQMEELREWEQMYLSDDDVMHSADGVFNIREQMLVLIEDYEKYLKMLPMTDENKRELVMSALHLSGRYCDTMELIGS